MFYVPCSMKKRGFTLIEMMVSVTIFTIVIAMGFGVFSSAIRLQTKALSSQKLLDEVSFVAEYMSRLMRMAVKDEDGSCMGVANLNYLKTASGVKFESYKDECLEFSRVWDGSEGVWRLREDKDGVQNYFTSPDFDVLSFSVGPDDSWDQNDSDQPRVTFSLEVEGTTLEPARIYLQTTISQRNLDIEI